MAESTGQQQDLGDNQSFVLRMRVETATDAPTGGSASEPLSERLVIRVEHVNHGDITLHNSLDSALTWLRTRMLAALPEDFHSVHPDPASTRRH